MISKYKPVGGVERCSLYPANAVEKALFSSEGCEVTLVGEPLEVELLDDMSSYEELTDSLKGDIRVSHLLNLVADREVAKAWFDKDFLDRAYLDGLVAQVLLADGRRLLVGYSALFDDEQPLRLESLISTSGTKLHDKPTVTLRLVSHDTEFACEII